MAGVVTKKKGFSSVLIHLKKKTNQHWTLHLNPQRLRKNQFNEEMVVINCINIPKYTHDYRVHRAQIKVRKCGIPAVFYSDPAHQLSQLRASMGTTSVLCNRVLVYLDTKSTAELS